MKERYKRGTVFLIAFIIAMLSCMQSTVCVNAAEDEKRTVRIGCSVATGYYQYDDESEIDGVGYDYEAVLAQYAGWNIEYVEGSWAELTDMLENGEIDMMGFLVKTEDREELYDYADMPSGLSYSCLVTLKSNIEYAYEDYESFQGMTVAYQKGNANISKLNDWCEKYNVELTRKEYATNTEVYEALDTGLVDAAILTNFNDLSDYNIVEKLLPESIYYAVTKGNSDLLNELNTALEDVSLYYPKLSNTIYANYFDEKNGYQITFSSEEMEYLETKPCVTVFPGGRSAPFEYFDEASDSYKGIVSEVLERISEMTGITFEYADTDDRWSYKTSEIKGNKITTFTNDFAWAELNDITVTQPFIKCTVSIITKGKKSNIKTVALVSNQYINYNVELYHPEWEVTKFDTQEECFDAVLNNQVDATIVNSVEADYYFTIGRYSILHEEISSEIIQNICLGITKDSDPLLVSVLSKSLLMIPTEEYSSITVQNINTARQMGLIDLIYTNPGQFVFISVFVIILLFVSVASLFRAKKSNRIIRKMSTEDVVTGLLNRSVYEKRVEKWQRQKVKNICCVYMDANGLHEINNLNGHMEGDIYLKSIAEQILNVYDFKDTFRIGGDEFLVLYRNASEDDCKRKLANLLNEFEKTGVSVSVGMQYEEDVNNLSELVMKADEEMLEYKREYYKKNDRRRS